MKLYFRGEEKGNLSYTTDGVRFTSTTLDALRNGITLPNDTDYTKVQVKAGSNVFSALDVVKKVELVQGGGADLEYDADALKNSVRPYLIANEKTSNTPGNISDLVYTIGANNLQFNYSFSSEGESYFYGNRNLGVLFQNKNTKRLEWQLDGAADDASDYEYVLVYSKNYPSDFSYFSNNNDRNKRFFVLANLGPIESFFEQHN
jgi:hypothetical protein